MVSVNGRSSSDDGEEGLVPFAQPCRKIRGGQIGPITELARNSIEDRIKNDVTEIACSHLIEQEIRWKQANAQGRAYRIRTCS